jgi:hypothetical protein
MANKTKYNKTLIKEILSELAVGKSIRSCLSPINKGIETIDFTGITGIFCKLQIKLAQRSL